MKNPSTISSGESDDSVLLCASDLQHSAIYDNHVEMQACIRAVADRLAALATQPAESKACASVGVERYEWLVANYDVRSLVQVGDFESLESFIDRKRNDNNRLDLRADAVRGAAACDSLAVTDEKILEVIRELGGATASGDWIMRFGRAIAALASPAPSVGEPARRKKLLCRLINEGLESGSISDDDAIFLATPPAAPAATGDFEKLAAETFNDPGMAEARAWAKDTLTQAPAATEAPSDLLAHLRATIVTLRSALGHLDNIAIADRAIERIDATPAPAVGASEPELRAAFEAWAAEEWGGKTPPHNAWLGFKGHASLSRAVGASVQPVLASLSDDERAELVRLRAIINTPQAGDFLRAVSTEAEHQRQRWGSDHDAGKTPADWFWLVGYLAGKALHAHAAGNTEKAEHHIITTGAACANWHLALFGKTDMRPGHEDGIDGDLASSTPTKGGEAS